MTGKARIDGKGRVVSLGTTAERLDLSFEDNTLLVPLFGEYHQNLTQIEHHLGVHMTSRGNHIVIEGPQVSALQAKQVLEELYEKLKQGFDIESGDVDGALRLVEQSHFEDAPVLVEDGSVTLEKDVKPGKDAVLRLDGGAKLVVRRRVLTPRSPTQVTYIKELHKTSMVFALGPAGTGKTFLAVARAVAALLEGEVDRIILSRPAVEAGENLGFLPGDMREKVDPYLRPLYDALYDLLPPEQVERRFQSGEIEIAPLAFMRGRTLSNAFVILDEAQNTTSAQMKMLLTRFGPNARMVIAGDPSQIDLPPKTSSGLKEAVATLRGIEDISIIHFNSQDVVRHPLVGRIVDAYEAQHKRDKG